MTFVETKVPEAQGLEPVLTKTRWLLLKRPQNLSEKQETRLAELLRHNLRTLRSYLFKKNFQFFLALHLALLGTAGFSINGAQRYARRPN